MNMAARTRVVFTPEIFVAQTRGGISRYFAELHRALPAFGVDSVVVAGLHSNMHLRGARRTIGAYIEPHRGTERVERWSAALCDAVIAEVAGAVVHRTYYVPAAPPRRAPLVVTVHDMIDELFPEHPHAPVISAQKRRWCALADIILVDSGSTRRDLIELFDIDEAKIVVVHLGARRLVGDAPPSPSFGEYLLYVGQRGGYKNFASLARAFAASRSSRALRLVCFGGGAPNPQERQLLHDLHIADRVSFAVGDDAALGALYVHARAMVYPSRYEGFGLPVLEAMLHGCPVACSSSASLPEVADDAAIMFDPDRIDEIVFAMEAVCEDGPRRRDLIARGRARGLTMDWARTARETARAYRMLA